MLLLTELFRLRYRLLWRAATGSRLRLLLFTVYHLLLLLSAVMALNAGATLALLGLATDPQHRILHMAVWLVCLGTMGSALFLGIGAEGAFSVTGLRRYPLSTWARHVFSHLLALATPVWIGCAVFSVSCALTFSVSYVAALMWRVPAALCFFLATYLAAGILAGLLKTAVESKDWLAGATVALTALLLGARYMGAAPVWAVTVAHWSPPGLFSTLLTTPGFRDILVRFSALLVWVAFLSLVMYGRSEERARGVTICRREFRVSTVLPSEVS